ncbi:MAG: TonB-dependent receptor domain-containing protein, partial [Flavobacteriales bacterium]
AFSNGYKVEGANGTGLRTDWNKFIRLDRSKLNRYVQLAWGGEYQFERYAINESSLLNGQPDDFRYRYDVDYHSGMAFFSADLTLDDTYFVNAGVSANKVLQLVEGNTSSDFRYDTTATWNWALLPRLAFNWQFKKNWYAFVSASAGNANPTVFEMVDYENNSYNLNLNPERGLNLEAGIKAKQYDNKWNFEVNGYQFYLSNAIVSYQDTSAGTGNEIYRFANAGSTLQRGIEWKLQLQLNKFFEESSRLIRFQFHHSGSVYDYVFKDFKIEDGQYDGIQFAGNKLPGVPLITLSNLLVVNFYPALQLDIQHQWFDKVPLNNQNSAWAGADNLLNVKASYQITLRKKLVARVFAGINNVTNAKYTSFYGLNNEFNRFYNPSPPTNYFGGLSLSWIFADRRIEILPD